MGIRTFVVWDSSSRTDRLNLEALAEEVGPDLDVLGLDSKIVHGALYDEVLKPRLTAAERILALVGVPGANMAFELGYGVGQSRPFALVTRSSADPTWLAKAGFPDHLVQRGGSDIRVLRDVLAQKAWASPPPPPVRPTGARLLLCPEEGSGRAPFERLQAALPGWRTLRATTWTLAELPALVGDAEAVAWVVPVPEGDEPRDGDRVTSHAFVAGWALAHGRRVRVFRDPEARRLADVAGRTDEYGSLAELVTLVRDWLTPPPPPEVDPEGTWRRWMREDHANLTPFLPDQRVAIGDVYVDLGVSARRAPEDDALVEARHGLGAKRRGTTLREALSTGPAPRIAVVAHPGAGKTTAVRHLVHTLAQEAGALPVFVPLAALDRRDPLEWAAESAAEDHNAPLLAPMIHELLRGRAQQPGGLWVFFDGFDEVAPGRRESITTRLANLARSPDWANVTVCMTTRPVAWDPHPVAGYAPVQLRALDETEQAELLGKLCPEEAERLVGEIRARPRVAQLVDNPLLLTLVAVTGSAALRSGLPFPVSRARLYEAAVRLLLGADPDTRRGGRHVREHETALRVLARVSTRLHEGGGETWKDTAVDEALWAVRREDADLAFRFRETWAENEAFLKEVAEQSGMFGRLDGPRSEWRYLHRTLREYLVARDLVDRGGEAVAAWVERWRGSLGRDKKVARKRDRVEEDDASRWGEVFTLVCGLLGEGAAPYLDVLKAADEGLLRRTLPTIDGLPSALAIRILLGCASWEEDDVMALTAAHGAALVPVLDERVRPEATIRELSIVWWALETLGRRPERAAFFTRAGRTLGKPPATVDIPAGSFWMGSPDGEGDDDEHPRHRVTLTRPFRMGRAPVTEAEWGAFMGERRRGKRPAVEISWYEARLYCAWVDGRLPTEAEWEYARRAGSEGERYGDVDAAAWHSGNSGRRRHTVGEKAANAWGLVDTLGNVWEWCEDEAYRQYPSEPAVDPFLPPAATAGRRVVRGGSWYNELGLCRSAYRNRRHPDDRNAGLGFRVVLAAPAP